MAQSAEHIKLLRDSSPYIDAHRGKTFVVALLDNALASDNLSNIISDLALLNSLGIRLIVVFGADQRIQALENDWLPGQPTSPELMPIISGMFGEITADLNARLAASSPVGHHDVRTISGNFLRARPIGVIDGIDHLNSGVLRSTASGAIQHALNGDAIVLLPSLGYSPSGESFYLDSVNTAADVAIAVGADKVIYLAEAAGFLDHSGHVISEIDLSAYREEDLTNNPDELLSLVPVCDRACRKGISRCHLLGHDQDGAILEELFTRDGCGTQIIGHSYEQIRNAATEDVSGIVKLIEPLEKDGTLVRRSRERLESEIDQFIVIERDGLLISCAALYDYGATGELACLVTHPDYRNGDRGDRLLTSIESRAREAGMKKLFVLTTQSIDWFSERGFTKTSIDSLPDDKQSLYNYQRNSSVLVKNLV